jgi:hypothetical protein
MKLNDFGKAKNEGQAQNPLPAVLKDDESQVPEPGEAVRTFKSRIEGRCERVDGNTVYFRTGDGRLMKCPMDKLSVIKKLEDGIGGSIVGAVAGAAITKSPTGASVGSKIGSGLQDMMTKESGLKFYPGSYPDVDHMHGAVYKGEDPGGRTTITNKDSWTKKANYINSVSYDDNADIISNRNGSQYVADGTVFAKWSNKSNIGYVLMPTTEGSMGGINRSRPAQDVSYEKVLDDDVSREVYEKWSMFSEESTDDKVGILKKWAMDNYENGADTFIETYSDEDYALMLDDHHGSVKDTLDTMERMASVWSERQADARYYSRGEMEEDIKKDFADILGKQHQEEQPKKKVQTKEIPFNGWTIRYSVKQKPDDKSKWMVFDKKFVVQGQGESYNEKQAVADAEEYIKKGGGAKKEATDKVTIDFNVDFTKEFGDTFFARILDDEDGPALLIAYEPGNGMQRTHIRNQKDKITATTTKLTSMSMSPRASNEAGLQPNGRYILGAKKDLGDGISKFPLIYQSTVQGKGDMVKLGKPGLTVAHSRDVSEDITPWGGYTKDDPGYKKTQKSPKNIRQGDTAYPLDQRIKNGIQTHGLKWAFDEYVKKAGIPPRQFQILAGLAPSKPGSKTQSWEKPAPIRLNHKDKESWWKKMVNKFLEEEDPCWKNYKQVGMKVKGGKKVPNCVPVSEHEVTLEGDEFIGQLYDEESLLESEYQGRSVTLNKPMQGDVKKFKVYVKDPSTGNVKKVNFGDPDMKIRKSNPEARKSFRARHNCDNPGPKTKARYWSCRKW